MHMAGAPLVKEEMGSHERHTIVYELWVARARCKTTWLIRHVAFRVYAGHDSAYSCTLSVYSLPMGIRWLFIGMAGK